MSLCHTDGTASSLHIFNHLLLFYYILTIKNTEDNVVVLFADTFNYLEHLKSPVKVHDVRIWLKTWLTLLKLSTVMT